MCVAAASGDQSFTRETMMFDVLKARSLKFALALAAAFFVAGVAPQARAQAPMLPPGVGTVHLKIVKGGFIIGGGGGGGTLHYNGHYYPLQVSGIGIGTIGIAETHLRGTASHLHSPYDIVGTYSTAGAGLAVGGGANVVTLQNERGVILRLQGTQVGFQATLGVGGMTISMR
jgi:hypothetical protein